MEEAGLGGSGARGKVHPSAVSHTRALDRHLMAWTKPESELLPLTHKIDDAGPASLGLLGPETIPTP